MQYCSFQHQTLLSPPDTSKTEHHFHFGPATSFFLELLVIALTLPQHHTGHLPTCVAHLPLPYLLAFSSCSWGSHSKNTGVVCHSLLQWTTLSELSTMIHPSWVALYSTAHSFIELCKPLSHDKAVIHEGLSVESAIFEFVFDYLPKGLF